MNYQILQWGPFLIDICRFFFIASVAICGFFIYMEGIKQNLNQDRLLGFILSSLVGGLMGMRLLFMGIYDRNEPVFRDLLRFEEGGLMFAGGLFGGFLAVILWSAFKKVPAGPYLDLAAPYLALGGVLGRLGYFSVGKSASYPWPWAIRVEGELLHPDQAYMIFFLSFLFVILWYKKHRTSYRGELFVWFLLGYGCIEFVVGFFRIAPMYGVLSITQVIALILILVSVFLAFAGKGLFTAAYVYSFNVIFTNRKQGIYRYILPALWVFFPVSVYFFLVFRLYL